MEEIWKDIPEYEGLYQVSSFGNVKSLSRVILKKGKYPFRCKEVIMSKSILSSGYYSVRLRKNNNGHTFKVHTLVAMAFLGHKPCGYKLVIDHINDDKLDNRVENLQVVTNRFNAFKTQGKYSSQYKGVYWNKSCSKWCASISIGTRNKHLGVFSNEHDAHLAYQKALSEILKTPLC